MHIKNVHCRLTLTKLILVSGICLFYANGASASIKIGLDFGTLQENRSATQLSSVGRTVYDGYMLLNFKHNFPLFLSLGYLYSDSIENFSDSSFTTVKTSNPYVGLAYQFQSKRTISIFTSALYSPFAKATLSTSAGSEGWDGATFSGKISLSVNISKRLNINTSLYYVNQSFGTRTSGNITSTNSLTQSYLAPAIGLLMSF